MIFQSPNQTAFFLSQYPIFRLKLGILSFALFCLKNAFAHVQLELSDFFFKFIFKVEIFFCRRFQIISEFCYYFSILIGILCELVCELFGTDFLHFCTSLQSGQLLGLRFYLFFQFFNKFLRIFKMLGSIIRKHIDLFLLFLQLRVYTFNIICQRPHLRFQICDEFLITFNSLSKFNANFVKIRVFSLAH